MFIWVTTTKTLVLTIWKSTTVITIPKEHVKQEIPDLSINENLENFLPIPVPNFNQDLNNEFKMEPNISIRQISGTTNSQSIEVAESIVNSS